MSTNAIDKTRDKMRLLSEREIEAANEKTTVMARRYGNKQKIKIKNKEIEAANEKTTVMARRYGNKFFETKKYSTADKKPTVTARRYGNNFFL